MVAKRESTVAQELNRFVVTRLVSCENSLDPQPFLSEVHARGKGSTVYTTHPYHTKVPIEAISPHIAHYTLPGDIILDPFCGSGMTGVAALANRRRAILVDLSPAAVHIAESHVTPAPLASLESASASILDRSREYEAEWYGTSCRKCGGKATIAYVIWSSEIRCLCGSQFLLWDLAVDSATGEMKRDSVCPHCGEHLLGHQSIRTGNRPVTTVYDCEGHCTPSRQEAPTNESEGQLIRSSEVHVLPSWAPDSPMMHVRPGQRWGEQWRPGYHRAVTHVRDFYTHRAWASLAFLYDQIQKEDQTVRKHLLFAFTACLPAVSRMVKYLPSRGGRSNTPGTLYIPALSLEQNVIRVFERRLHRILSFARWQADHSFQSGDACVVTGSATNLGGIPDDSIDYVFTDPPFAENIQYAELNFLIEAWLRAYTETSLEAVISPARGLGPNHFAHVMKLSFQEMFRVLKKGHFCTVIFHNTSAKNWQMIMSAVRNSGFKLESVTFIDKGQSGWNQVTSEYAANFDPVLHLRKIDGGESPRSTLYLNKGEWEQQVGEIVTSHLLRKPDGRQRTTAYLHSLIVRSLLLDGREDLTPSPRQLASMLEQSFVKKDRSWFRKGEGMPLRVLSDFVAH